MSHFHFKMSKSIKLGRGPNWDPHPFFRKRVSPPPGLKGRGHTLLRVRGLRGSQVKRLEKKPNTLSAVYRIASIHSLQILMVQQWMKIYPAANRECNSITYLLFPLQSDDYFMYLRAIFFTFQISVDFYFVPVGGRGGGRWGAGEGEGARKRGIECILYGYT
jgi:hypothetical protein